MLGGTSRHGRDTRAGRGPDASANGGSDGPDASANDGPDVCANVIAARSNAFGWLGSGVARLTRYTN